MQLAHLSPENLEAAYQFHSRMASITDNICHRRFDVFVNAAKLGHGTLAIENGTIRALSCVFSTDMPGIAESGATCIDLRNPPKGLGRLIFITALVNFLRHNQDSSIIFDIFTDNPSVVNMISPLKIRQLHTPRWYQANREKKLTPKQLERPFSCHIVTHSDLPRLYDALSSFIQISKVA